LDDIDISYHSIGIDGVVSIERTGADHAGLGPFATAWLE